MAPIREVGLGAARRQVLKVAALATGLADKAVSLFYERALHQVTSAVWVERCRTQIGGVLAALEASRRTSHTTYWFGPTISHADIAVACALRFLSEAHPGLFDPATWPVIARSAAACEALEVFQVVAQPFIPPS
jgi:glutathione S-transferase